jgi:hypothetical protein
VDLGEDERIILKTIFINRVNCGSEQDIMVRFCEHGNLPIKYRFS